MLSVPGKGRDRSITTHLAGAVFHIHSALSRAAQHATFCTQKKPKWEKQGGEGAVGALGDIRDVGVLQWKEGAPENVWRRTGNIHGGEKLQAVERPTSS